MNPKKRIVKEPEERKNEILDVAESLFMAKGYEGTSVNNILFAVNIAKGTFYYHFKSKEEVLDALIERHIKIVVANAKQIIASPLSPFQKLLTIFTSQKQENKSKEGIISVLHEKDNSKMHVKSITQTITHLSPYIAGIINEGIEKGLYTTRFPLESAEILLTAGMVLLDDDFFQWSNEEQAKKITAFLTVIERALGAKEGSFMKFSKALEK